MAKEIDSLFDRYNYKQLETQTNQPVGQLVIKNFGAKPIERDRDLANLLGIGRKLDLITFVKRLTSPTTYIIHCDLIDKEQNVFNSKKSDVLALFDIKGKPFEKVSYHGSPQHLLRDCSTDEFINSITISVKDENGELFDFKGKKLDLKIKKHQEITMLAVAKRDTINRLLSKAFNNNEVSSHEFDNILSEFQQYNTL